MAKDKYELYRVNIRGIANITCASNARCCCKYILNNITAEEMLDFLNIMDAFKSTAKQYLNEFIVIDNMNMEQLACLYIALDAYSRTGYDYEAPSRQSPISMRLNEELINKLLQEIYLTSKNEFMRSEEVSDIIEKYPIMGPKKKFNWRINNIRFLIFADMWSRATNQVMTFELYTMLEKKKG